MQITEDCLIYCDYWLPNKNALTIPVLTRIRVRLIEPTSPNKLKKRNVPETCTYTHARAGDTCTNTRAFICKRKRFALSCGMARKSMSKSVNMFRQPPCG